ncbi:hypothetical protein Bbelb_333190 [Branchiostoma belcheri]|nr:hypothetical protein Bbelb_333190 [Branchiostoma belcheri]
MGENIPQQSSTLTRTHELTRLHLAKWNLRVGTRGSGHYPSTDGPPSWHLPAPAPLIAAILVCPSESRMSNALFHFCWVRRWLIRPIRTRNPVPHQWIGVLQVLVVGLALRDAHFSTAS